MPKPIEGSRRGLAPQERAVARSLAATQAFSKAGVLLLFGLLVATSLSGQVTVLQPDAPFESFPIQEFQSLVKQGSAVGFLPGSLDRAHYLLLRLDNLAGFFRRWQPDLPIPLAAYAVDRDSWKEIGLPGLYGLPLRTSPSSIFVPAAGDEEAVRMWRSALGVETLPMVPGVPVVGTAEQAATLALSDVLLQLEASRGFAVAAKLKGNQSWVQEVAAHVAALVAFHQTEPQRIGELNDLFDRLRSRMGGPQRFDDQHFSQDLQRGTEDEVKAWLWYQGVFFSAAEMIVAKDGKRSVQKLLKMRQADGRVLGQAALMKRYSGLQQWHTQWFKEPTGEYGLSAVAVGTDHALDRSLDQFLNSALETSDAQAQLEN